MSDNSAKIAERLTTLRHKRGLTLAELSGQLGISKARLQEMESGTSAPSLGTLVRLAQFYEVALGEIFGDSADSPFCLVRKDAREAVSRFGSIEGRSHGYSYKGLGQQKENRQMEPFLVTLAPEQEHRVELNEHVGEEFIFVLDGEVEVTLLGNTDILYPGDSIYYDSTLAHRVACAGDEPATILAVIYAKQEMIIL
ncbi:helix-turn-helix domain-containing protein [Desulforhopalus singaporensis]|uniref:Transcriptional regulator, XRE family with cupin sensor n=1 Tax=Desulforhopalus singaporensis TaxID=91360 RepID=A0A1H0LCG6_9BACT|nr:cupin domain-containing protein [Desulforhopalus singaporensis]SDO65878.1 transcriptional regulator, XRE family with cupin sensor [Desulforhopalus singaporensis]